MYPSLKQESEAARRAESALPLTRIPARVLGELFREEASMSSAECAKECMRLKGVRQLDPNEPVTFQRFWFIFGRLFSGADDYKKALTVAKASRCEVYVLHEKQRYCVQGR